MTDIKTLEKIIDRFVPCMCSFTKGFAYDKNTKCDCDNSEAKQALNLYIEERERLARLKGVEEVLLRLKQAPPIDWLDAQTWIDGEYERLQDRIKELEGLVGK